MDLESDIRLMLGSLKADERLQLQFYTSSDFSGPLNRFVENTRANSKVEICSMVRDELAFRYRGRMACETLIQANVRLYLSSQIPKLMSAAGRRVRGFDEVFKFCGVRSIRGSNFLIYSCAATAAAFKPWTTRAITGNS